jgi:hypothetical protein
MTDGGRKIVRGRETKGRGRVVEARHCVSLSFEISEHLA